MHDNWRDGYVIDGAQQSLNGTHETERDEKEGLTWDGTVIIIKQ